MKAIPALLVGTASACGAIQSKTVEYKVGDRAFEAFVVYDDAKATPTNKQPGILVCPEWWGNNEYARTRARQLAELGYVAVSIDLYGKDDGKLRLTTNPEEAGKWAAEVSGIPGAIRERAAAGYKVLTSLPQVDPTRTAAIGYCMGGTVALELARTGVPLNAVVTFHTSTIAAKEPADNKAIKASVLVCHGQDDAFVSDEQIKSFHSQMKDAGVEYQFASYSGAVHSFTNSGADAFKIPGVAYQKAADHRSWESMQALFREKFNAPAATKPIEKPADGAPKSQPVPEK